MNWGMEICYVRRKCYHCRDLLLKVDFLTSKLDIEKFCFLKLHINLILWGKSEALKEVQATCKLKRTEEGDNLFCWSTNEETWQIALVGKSSKNGMNYCGN